MKVLIIEDENLSYQRLKRLLEEQHQGITIEGPLASVESTVEHLSNRPSYDIILSDIRLQGRLVFEAFHEVKPQAPVIFTTAYDEYAIEAFRNNGIDYLLKPIDANELTAAFEKVMSFTERQSTSISSLQDAARSMRCYRERILTTKGDELIPLQTKDIRYFRKEEDFTVAHTKDNKSYRLHITMNDLEAQLNPDLFFRLNRQYLVHIDSIKKINLFFSSKLSVQLHDCDENNIIVSKERSAEFKQWLNR